jgi:hypothetical protein
MTDGHLTQEDYIAQRIEKGRHLVPPHMWEGLTTYFVHHIPVGSFMTALLSNDLMGAAGRADAENLRSIGRWCQFLYTYAPARSFGSPEAVTRWLNPEEVSDDPQG